MGNNTTQLLSDIVVFSKYAKYIPELKRRETWEELVTRNAEMHTKKYPELADEIFDVYAKYVIPKKVFPSMRSLQFGGIAIERNHSRMFNCSYRPADTLSVFDEAMFLLLGGSGFGVSVQQRHVKKLPKLQGPKRNRTKLHVVEDSIMGWSNAVKVLIKSYFKNKMLPRFDFSDIRPRGALLKTAGGKAPGPEPLKVMLAKVTAVLENALTERGVGTKVKPIEVYDIICHISDAVLAGGIRRSAIITLFSFEDHEMRESKVGPWWELNPQRGRSNNSVVLDRTETTEDMFYEIWRTTHASGAGEPGFTWTSNKDYGVNPCCEISLRAESFCNLTTMIVTDVETQEELDNMAKAASFIGTLQAGYTDFHYLGDSWHETTSEDSLLGVSMTGIASGKVLNLDIDRSARCAVEENQRVADIIGIPHAKRVTAIKPEGTASLVAGCSSGIHAYFADYYVRRMRLSKDEPIYQYLAPKLESTELMEDDMFAPSTTSVISVPIKSPDGAIIRTESELELLERVKLFQDKWITAGHVDGDNKNNVSVTVSIKDDAWDEVGEWMWENRDSYTGISVLPYDGGTYPQLPFTDSDKDEFDRLSKLWETIDFDITEIIEEDDNVEFGAIAACAGGGCEVGSV